MRSAAASAAAALRRCVRERVKRLFKCFMLCLAKCYCCLNYFVLFMLFIPKYFLCARQNNKKNTNESTRNFVATAGFGDFFM